ncbi:hypothetical protein [Xylanibacter muris]|uniref:SGNH/GDSL hydrolase family protein n=1 Tax=Xylanibacter muris TaxID=2736290 RepID=A0ABX2AIQ7_9BACT|nr:hypothetical protein [Xylanibacter muris]NPD90876.1 hypothetical protein [Xylanibacter muris]
MKTFLIKILAALLTIIACDVCFGFTFDYLREKAKGGETGRTNYICDNTNEDVLIMGSSRAVHHYDPNIITDSLGMNCYNCGYDGNGIILNYGLYKMLSKRYNPKVIVYEITSAFDLLKGDNKRFLKIMRPFYNRTGIDSIFFNVDETEKFKNISHMYRYNTSFTQVLRDSFVPKGKNDKGYKPSDKRMEYEPVVNEDYDAVYEYDDLKLSYLKRFIIDCRRNGTKLIFVLSPSYKKTIDREFMSLYDICKEYGIPFFNHYCDYNFVNNKDYFYDSVHMNRIGATKYTELIVSELKEVL